GSNQLIPYSPPYTPPPPPMPPGSPVIVQRAPFSISLGFAITDPSVTANAIERSGANGVWTVLQTYGPVKGFQQFTDHGDPIPTRAGTTAMRPAAMAVSTGSSGGLTPDTLYCYRMRSTNPNGSTLSTPQCVYTREYVTDDAGNQIVRSVSRVQLHLVTGNVTNAGTDDAVEVLLNSASTTISVPALNHTWVDSPR